MGVPFQVKQPSVRVKVAAVVLVPAQAVVALTGLVGKVAYAPGSVTVIAPVTLPPETVALKVAGELVVV